MTVHFDKLDNQVKPSTTPVGVMPVSHRRGLYRNYLKRMVDIAVALISLPVVVPIIAVLALLVTRDGHSPFYTCKRVGRGGKNFGMLKLRSMVPDADHLLATYLAENSDASEEWNLTQKLKDDPRVTEFGRFLRKTSMDELPQLWNVLKGDMSLVGPRPMTPVQKAMYPGNAYYALRPGITGAWQVSERNEAEFAKRAEHDRDYDVHLSFAHDVAILLRTVGVVVRGTGY